MRLGGPIPDVPMVTQQKLRGSLLSERLPLQVFGSQGTREQAVGNSQGCCVGVRGCSEVLELSSGLACEKTGDSSLVREGPDHRRLQVDEKLRLDLRGIGSLGTCTILAGCPGCVCLKFHVSCPPQRRWRGCQPWSPCHFYPVHLGRFLFS